MAQSPERYLLNDVWNAHQLAGKAHKDGAKPLTRLGGAIAVGAIGVGGEALVKTVRPTVLNKLGIEEPKLHPLLDELLDDGLVGAIYTIANKNLGEAFPKLKLGHFATSTVGTIAVKGTEGLRGKLGEDLATRRAKRAKTKAASTAKTPPVAPAEATPAPADTAGTPAAPAEATIPASTTAEASAIQPATTGSAGEGRKSLLDFVNPVTALAADEARLALRDMVDAYRAVVSGTEEEFIVTHKPKDEKELPVSKETTIVYLGNNQPVTPIPS